MIAVLCKTSLGWSLVCAIAIGYASICNGITAADVASTGGAHDPCTIDLAQSDCPPISENVVCNSKYYYCNGVGTDAKSCTSGAGSQSYPCHNDDNCEDFNNAAVDLNCE